MTAFVQQFGELALAAVAGAVFGKAVVATILDLTRRGKGQ